MPFCFMLAIHTIQIPTCGEKSHIITISGDQKTSLMKRDAVIFRKPENCPNVLFDCPFDSLHHAERLGRVELNPKAAAFLCVLQVSY